LPLDPRVVVFVAIIFIVAPAVLPAISVSSIQMTSESRPKFASCPTNSCSLNWSGYAVTSGSGSVTDVKGSWTVPSVTCSGTTNQYSSFWVGIDGYNSGTVEQTGTDSDCSSGAPRYYAWYEFYPKPSFLINVVSVHAGDRITAEVRYAGGKFVTTITDTTTGQSYSASARVRAQRSSAEWIAEAPSSSGGILPLANFGTVGFGTSTADTATVGGTTGAIGTFPTVWQITMVTSAGAVKAQPSPLGTDQSSFSVKWYSSGP
jgi:hypothetical protein